MVILQTHRGRPSRQQILEQVDLGVSDLARAGGLPVPAENEAIWRDIWYEEAHASTAIEGNTLILKEVRALLDEGRSVGNKELREYLEVQAYANAARWVYAQARTPEESVPDGVLLTLTELRHIHALAVGPVWELFPPDGLDPAEGPGSFRRHDIAQFPDGMVPPPFTQVHAAITDWLDALGSDRAATHPIVRIAAAHGEFERIHPFRDGNGRVGRLILNLLLVRSGYPPAVLRNKIRTAYLKALRRSDAGDQGPLTEIVARAVKESLDRFLLPSLAGPTRLLPLSALALDARGARALRAAVERGRLRAVKGDGDRWLSTREWVDAYRSTRRIGRPPKADGVRPA
ncbi:MAG: Fic family protein [Chloroflexi bacterium]|nr:Fic family protein [Chloroflexota bacterium]